MIQRARPEANARPRRARSESAHLPREALALFGVALALRVAYAWLAHGPGAGVSSDAATYDAVAWNLARGLGFSLNGASGPYPTAFVPPVMPWLVSLVYRSPLGHDVFAAIVLQCAIGATVPLLLRALVDRLAGSPAARIAGWLAAVHPLLVFFSGHLLTEATFTAALLVALVATLEWVRTPRPGRAFGVGLLWGLAALTRPTALPLPFVVAAWAWFPLGLTLARGDRTRQIALLLLAWALAIAPWTIRNAARLHAFVPVTTGGGRSLLDANNPIVWDDPRLRGGATSVYHLEPYASALRGRSEAEQDATSARLAREHLRSHRGRWPAVAAAKFTRFWRLGAEAGTTGAWAREGSPIATLLSRVDPLLLWSLATWPLAGFGLVVVFAGSRRLYQSLPLVLIVLATLGAIVYWGSLRLRVPVEPLVLAYAGIGAAELLRRRRVRGSGLRVVERASPE